MTIFYFILSLQILLIRGNRIRKRDTARERTGTGRKRMEGSAPGVCFTDLHRQFAETDEGLELLVCPQKRPAFQAVSLGSGTSFNAFPEAVHSGQRNPEWEKWSHCGYLPIFNGPSLPRRLKKQIIAPLSIYHWGFHVPQNIFPVFFKRYF